MSLSAMGGGGLGGAGGGGIAIAAHQVNQPAQVAAMQPPPQANFGSAGAGAGAGGTSAGVPPTLAAFAADLLDKQHQLTRGQVKSVAHLALVGIDASSGSLASFSPKQEDLQSLRPTLLKPTLKPLFLKEGEASYKTLRKYLAQERTYDQLVRDSISHTKGIAVKHPHLWLGERSTQGAPEFLKAMNESIVSEEESAPSTSTSAIAQDTSTETGVQLINGTLEGTSQPTGDTELDRVLYNLKLSQNKKSLQVLPEEMAGIWIRQVQQHVF
ncbi:MAG: hypothetical protein AAGJ35_14080, partial [Myxococcota bacterium]